MNQEGLRRCEELQNRERSASELKDELTRTRMMSLLCHCSAEIDQGTLLYFSVHNMYLGSGDFLLLLFSELSSQSEMQESGMDVYSRMSVYHLIEEEAGGVLRDHMSFYSAELDGRLVILIQFPYGLLPAHREGLLEQVGESCCRITENCRKKYDINVVTYISNVMDHITRIASTYHKMLSVATLHRYTRRKLDPPYYRLLLPEDSSPSPIQFQVQENAKAVAQAIVEHGPCRKLLSGILEDLAAQPFMSVEDLKKSFGDLFEGICEELQKRGIRLNVSKIRQEEMNRIMEDTDWQIPVNWLLNLADSISASCNTDTQTTSRQNMENVQEYIRNHLTDPNLSVKSVSEDLGISSTALSGMFSQQLGTTPARYIRKLRLEKAGDLLRTTSLSIQEVCDSCGFGSLETFHRVFREEYGITPGKLRRLSRLEPEEARKSSLNPESAPAEPL